MWSIEGNDSDDMVTSSLWYSTSHSRARQVSVHEKCERGVQAMYDDDLEICGIPHVPTCPANFPEWSDIED